MRRTTLLACVLCAAFPVVAPAQVPAPRVLSPDFNTPPERRLNLLPPFLHWDLREFPNCRVPWALNTAGIPDFNGNLLADDAGMVIPEFLAAFNVWQAVEPALISFVMSGTPPAPGGHSMDGYNTVGWGTGTRDDVQLVQNGSPVTPLGQVVWAGPNNILESQPMGDDLVNGLFIHDGGNGLCETFANTWDVTGLVAVTGLFYNNRSGVILEADIVLAPGSGNLRWVLSPAVNDGIAFDYNVRGVVTHEIGHFIGIAHPDMAPVQNVDAADGISPTMTQDPFPAFDLNNFNQTLENLDRDACNFLYCPDLGDAPDPCIAGAEFNVFPSLVHKTGGGRVLNQLTLDRRGLGAEHIFGIKGVQIDGVPPDRNYTYEWLTKFPLPGPPGASAECEANITDADPLDDGVTWWPNPPVWGRKMRVKQHIRYASDADGLSHSYPTRPLYANGWLDTNQNCIWEEHFMSVEKKPTPPAGVNNVQWTAAFGAVDLPAVVNADFPVWLRCRLDYNENVGARSNIDGTLDLDKGAAQFGEVEDYPFYCTTRYEVQWLCNPYPFPIPGVAMVYVGPSDLEDLVVSVPVDENDAPTGTNPPPVTTYNAITDESLVYCPAIVIVPPNGYFRSGKCRPNTAPNAPGARALAQLPSQGPQTKLRSFFTTDLVPAGTPAALVPPELRIPTVNCGTSYLPGTTSPGTVQFTVGAVDFENGGWIDGPDTLTGEWSDTLRVTVAYRVSPQLIPVQNLSRSDPLYAALPLVPVGSGVVTPEEGFVFTLDVPADLPLGSYAILEVESRWSTNDLVNHEIIEFPVPVGSPTGVDAPALPSVLSLDNYPNPFNPGTVVRYALPQAARVRLDVYDVSGAHVRTLVRGARQPAGVFEVEWDGRDGRGAAVVSGVYFFRLEAGAETLTHKALLLK